jgi:hypothetical protein
MFGSSAIFRIIAHAIEGSISWKKKHKCSSHITVNTASLGYKYQSPNAVKETALYIANCVKHINAL